MDLEHLYLDVGEDDFLLVGGRDIGRPILGRAIVHSFLEILH